MLYNQIMTKEIKHYRRVWGTQKSNAKRRGIEFKLTYEQWIDWWLNTGHFEDRGLGKGKYVMSRIGDSGAYELGNIECKLHEENGREAGYRSKPPKSRPWSLKTIVTDTGERYIGFKDASEGTGYSVTHIHRKLKKGDYHYDYQK